MCIAAKSTEGACQTGSHGAKLIWQNTAATSSVVHAARSDTKSINIDYHKGVLPNTTQGNLWQQLVCLSPVPEHVLSAGWFRKHDFTGCRRQARATLIDLTTKTSFNLILSAC
jgi:hypothetical protein